MMSTVVEYNQQVKFYAKFYANTILGGISSKRSSKFERHTRFLGDMDFLKAELARKKAMVRNYYT